MFRSPTWIVSGLCQWIINTYRQGCMKTNLQADVDVVMWGTCVHKAGSGGKKEKGKTGAITIMTLACVTPIHLYLQASKWMVKWAKERMINYCLHWAEGPQLISLNIHYFQAALGVHDTSSVVWSQHEAVERTRDMVERTAGVVQQSTFRQLFLNHRFWHDHKRKQDVKWNVVKSGALRQGQKGVQSIVELLGALMVCLRIYLLYPITVLFHKWCYWNLN